jgi:uncharacterized protein (DUF433 family)
LTGSPAAVQCDWLATTKKDRVARGRTVEKLDRITMDPNVCLGQPTLRGLRITVSVVLKMLAAGKSVQDVLAAYPELEAEDVRQAMRYAAWVVSDQMPAASA